MRLNQGQKQTILDTLVKEKFAEAEECVSGIDKTTKPVRGRHRNQKTARFYELSGLF